MSAPGFLESISPWASRSNTPRPSQGKGGDTSPQLGLNNQSGTDHAVTRRHRLSIRDYPDDCPKIAVKWFYAVDFPKRKPIILDKPLQDSKPPQAPKKYVAFSAQDSRAIESAFQTLVEKKDLPASQNPPSGELGNSSLNPPDNEPKHNTSINDIGSAGKRGSVKVPVNEDYLFDVDVEKRELAPAYWLGLIYDVRRGSWFYQEGSSLRPCDENLATQLEEGYLKVKPWRYESNLTPLSTARSRSRPTSLVSKQGLDRAETMAELKNIQSRSSDNLKNKFASSNENQTHLSEKFQLQTQRLFGAYMNSVVTYQDSTVAWLLTDDFLSRMSSTVYQRFAGGGHLGGVKVVRGFSETTKLKEKQKESEANSHATSLPVDDSVSKHQNPSEPAAPKPDKLSDDKIETKFEESEQEMEPEIKSEPKLRALERQMSSFVSSPGPNDQAKQDEELRKRDEDEIQEDYRETDGDDQAREIEHLILVTHGIGQRLGLRVESINFIHDVNVLRKTLKNVYETSPDLQALNAEVEKLPKNCRIQVLPVVWRHLLDFPKQSVKENRKEQDLTDADILGDEVAYPSLDDITVEGVPAIRNLITDLALDILLYQSAYREHIAGIVQRECNRVYHLFLERNPSFSGKVSLIGHSLGSAILFDILCHQKEQNQLSLDLNKQNRRRSRASSMMKQTNNRNLELDFEVEDFYCLGSPLGLYQMLKGRKIAARKSLRGEPAESPLHASAIDDPFLGASLNQSEAAAAARESDILSITVSSPKCNQLFNIFHPADPISYRLEPLISPAMSTLKPQPLPYIKKGMFGVPAQGITAIGTRVGQSVSGLWSNITSGVASSLLNRSLGLTGEGQISSSQSIGVPQTHNRLSSAGAGTNITAGGVISASVMDKDNEFKSGDEPTKKEDEGSHPPTLIDSEIETLFSGFQKCQSGYQNDQEGNIDGIAEQHEANENARRLRREEAKVRALNRNGRVDFSVQESMFDISLLASIASHLSYWADVDSVIMYRLFASCSSLHRSRLNDKNYASFQLADIYRFEVLYYLLMDNNMRAVDIKGGAGNAEALFINEIPKPQARGSQAIVKIKAFGLNRMDLLQREGHYPVPPQAPKTLGVEFSGIIESFGEAAETGFTVGDEVFGLAYGGAYAEYIAVSTHMLLHKPKELSWEETAGIPETWITASQAMYLVGEFAPGKSILWHAGASSVSIAGIQLSVADNASAIYVTAGSDHKIDFCVKELGATAGYNYHTQDWSQEILKATDGKGVDIIIDFVGQSYFQGNLDAAARDGRIVNLGALSGSHLAAGVDLSAFVRKRLRFEGSSLRSRDEEYQGKLRNTLADHALPKLQDGSFKVFVEKVFPWEDIVQAHKLMETNETKGKIVCTIG